MKLQNLIIIFIIIIIPIVLIFSLYLKLETKTIILQTDYDEKLIEATKEAVEAFEINTTEWNNKYSSLANSKRQDISSSINVFSSSLANKLGIGGTSKENILNYVPAIVFTMYDGYYIYSPTHVPQTITNENGIQLFYYENSGSEDTKVTDSATQNIGGVIYAGEPIYVLDSEKGTATGIYNDTSFTTNADYAKKIYKHVLKTFIPYTTKNTLAGKDYVINYTLDDYVRIYGKNEAREGYIIDDFYNGGTCRITVPINSISGIKFDGEDISLEILTENIAVRNSIEEEVQIKNYRYIYNSNNDKRYYDDSEGKFFTVNKNYVKVNLPDTEKGTTLAEYKKVLMCTNATNGEYIELYQLLNGNDNTWYYINSNNEYIAYSNPPSIDKSNDCSAINYYVGNYNFNKWLRMSTGLGLDEDEIQDILNGKKQAIINNINNNLNLSMSNYSANSKIDYKLPELTDEDWEQAFSNISMITFFQGTKVGLKTYNNYVVVTSTHNNEYVSEDSLYYLGDYFDKYYHRYNCNSIQQAGYIAYRNTEFKVQKYGYKNRDGNTSEGYYYKHAQEYRGEIYDQLECYDCIVNRNNIITNVQDEYEGLKETAIARERYVQMQRTRLTKTNAIILDTDPEVPEPEIPHPEEPIYDALNVTHNITSLENNRTISLNIAGGSGNYTIAWSYRSTSRGIFIADSSASNQTVYTKDKTYYIRYVVRDTTTGEQISILIPGEIADTPEFDVTYTTESVRDGTEVTFTISGGTQPYKYQVSTIDGLWSMPSRLPGNTLKRTVQNRFTIRFLDNAGNTKTITIVGGVSM